MTSFTNSIVSFIEVFRIWFEFFLNSGRVGFKTPQVSSGPVWNSSVSGRVGFKISHSCSSLFGIEQNPNSEEMDYQPGKKFSGLCACVNSSEDVREISVEIFVYTYLKFINWQYDS